MEHQPPVIVDGSGRPVKVSKDCPQCGATEKRRRPSSGFGIARPLCGDCGYEWKDEVWRG